MLCEFVDHISPFYEHRAELVEHFIATEGTIEYSDLWFVYKAGKKIITMFRDKPMGGIIKNAKYTRGFVPSYAIDIVYVQTNGVEFGKKTKTIHIFAFTGRMHMNDLELRIIDDESTKMLTERGKIFERLALKSTHMYYDDNMWIAGWMNMSKVLATGRVMVDVTSFNRYNPNYTEFDRLGKV